MGITYADIDPDIAHKMEEIQNWAEAQLPAEGTPWAGFHYMCLIDSIKSIFDGRHYVSGEPTRWSEMTSQSEAQHPDSDSSLCDEPDG